MYEKFKIAMQNEFQHFIKHRKMQTNKFVEFENSFFFGLVEISNLNFFEINQKINKMHGAYAYWKYRRDSMVKKPTICELDHPESVLRELKPSFNREKLI